MSEVDPRIDAYIAKAPPFARPILEHIRRVMHAACPQAVETIKWGFPHFTYNDKLLGGIAAFKAHASLGLWHMGDKGPSRDVEGMGQFGKLTQLTDLPDDVTLTEHIHMAMALIDAGPAAKPKKAPRPEPAVPQELIAALARAPVAKATFDDFSPTNRRDYCEWIGEAKRPETRAARVAQAIEWMAEGKPRHWKYQR
jgi:hypothetical protein